MDAAGVVADHAAERAAAVRCRIGSEGQCKLLRRLAHAIEHDAGLHMDGARNRIDCAHPVHVLRKVKNDGGVRALAGDRGAASAREYRRAQAAADGDRGDHIVLVPGNDKPDGDMAIVRRVGGVGGPGSSVETNLATNLFTQPLLQFGGGGELLMRAGVRAGQKSKGRRGHEGDCSPKDSSSILKPEKRGYDFYGVDGSAFPVILKIACAFELSKLRSRARLPSFSGSGSRVMNS